MLIATTGSGSINISESEKSWFQVCKKNQDCWFRLLHRSQRVAGFHERSHKESAFFWVVN
jgi:hypothetical protein